MIILGIAPSHNSSAALMIGGVVCGLIQEERLSRRKNQLAYPQKSIERLIAAHLGGQRERVRRTVVATRELDLHCVAIDRYSDYPINDFLNELREYWYPRIYEGRTDGHRYWQELYKTRRNLNQDHNYDLSFIAGMSWEAAARYFKSEERSAVVHRQLGANVRVEFVDHHTCHAYYARYGGKLPTKLVPETLVLTADAWGDGKNWSAWITGDGDRLIEVGSGADHRVALIYKYVTLILGMRPNHDEHKVMGLSPYSRNIKGIQEAEKVLFEALDFRDGDFIAASPLQDPYFDLRQRLEGHRFDNVAAAVQNWATSVTVAWARHWLESTGRRVLCFSGGLSMNVKLNGEMLKIRGLKGLAVPASGGDESLSAGATFVAACENGESVRAMTHVFLGDSPSAKTDWRDAVVNYGGSADEFALKEGFNLKMVARLLAANHIVARCVGRAEFGSRALGNRSILAHPSYASNVKVLNDVIKNRDFWMPFALSIMAEYADRYVEADKCCYTDFMTVAFQTSSQACHDIIGGLHPADFTTRPQVVSKTTSAEFWQLLEEFRLITRIPALLNTSLNRHGEPMSYSCEDAIGVLVRSELDILLLPGDQLLFKKRASDVVNAAFEGRRIG